MRGCGVMKLPWGSSTSPTGRSANALISATCGDRAFAPCKAKAPGKVASAIDQCKHAGCVFANYNGGPGDDATCSVALSPAPECDGARIEPWRYPIAHRLAILPR